MYACGLRVGETVHLPLCAVDSKSMALRIVGKRNKERLVPLPAALLKPMREHWKTHQNPKWIFPAYHGQSPICLTSLRQAFGLARKAAGIDPRITCHSLRHGYATRLLENGSDLRVIQTLLGHASMSSTQIYTHLTEPMRAEIRQRVDVLFAGLL